MASPDEPDAMPLPGASSSSASSSAPARLPREQGLWPHYSDHLLLEYPEPGGLVEEGENPIGPDGIVTRFAEHVPILNSGIQRIHQWTGSEEALERARQQNPIGPDGVLTQLFEHVPGLSDGVMALHRIGGQEMAAERARAHTLQKLLSKDGAITRLAELLPVSNLFAAAMHGLSGNREEALRALDLMEGWASSFKPDGPFARIAELLPGTDAFAFALHVQGGHYAQALRSVTKTSWVNVGAARVVGKLQCARIKEIKAVDIEPFGMEVIPRQLSVLVGMADILANFARGAQEGRRQPGVDVESVNNGTQAMEVTKEMLKRLIDQLVQKRVKALQSAIPSIAEWLVRILDNWFQRMRRADRQLRAILPRSVPLFTPALVGEFQRSFPRCRVQSGPLPRIEPVKLRRRRVPAAEAAAAGCCFSAFACGLGVKAGALACCAGLMAGTMALGRLAVRKVVAWVDRRNADAWESALVKPLPEYLDEDGRPVVRSEQASVAASSSSAPEDARKGPPGDSADEPRGCLLVFEESDVAMMADLARSYVLEHCYRGSSAVFLRLLEPVMHFLARRNLETARGTIVPFVTWCSIESEWSVTMSGYSWEKLRMPPGKFAMMLHLSLESGVFRTVGMFVAFPDAWVERICQRVGDQVQKWDIREIDSRFRGFTEPIHVDFDLAVRWSSGPAEVTLEARGVRSRLDLPE